VRAGSDFRLRQLKAYYRSLYAAFGPQHWWPGHTPIEVIVGAYLAQNTSWNNVDLALRRLRKRRALTLKAIRKMSVAELEDAIRPAGYFRQKAARLKTFVEFVDRHYGGSLKRMFAVPPQKLRQQLLDLNGVGPETADSILLYAGLHPVFVVDAYARRIVDRHKILPGNAPYDEIRELFERAFANENQGQKITGLPLPDSAHTPSPMSRAPRSATSQILNEAHALVVAVGKHYCFKSSPDCHNCPLGRFLTTS
jgi:endonuclease-3 related protein